MNMLNLYEKYQQGREENIIFELKGLISQEILVGFVELIKDKIFLNANKNYLVRKIFSVFIELFQNIVRHSADKNGNVYYSDGIGSGIIILKSNGIHYTISSGNLIKNNNVSNLTDLITKINSLDKEELKKFYKERLKTNRKGNMNNSGVGLIDIARKSGNPLDLSLKSINKFLSFCEISVKIDKEVDE